MTDVCIAGAMQLLAWCSVLSLLMVLSMERRQTWPRSVAWILGFLLPCVVATELADGLRRFRLVPYASWWKCSRHASSVFWRWLAMCLYGVLLCRASNRYASSLSDHARLPPYVEILRDPRGDASSADCCDDGDAAGPPTMLSMISLFCVVYG